MSISKGGQSKFVQVLHELEHAQKPGVGVPAYTRWINRRAARAFAAGAVASGLGPNTVSLLSACSSLVGLVLLVLLPASWGTGIATACFLALGYIMDSADGQVARVTGTGSPAGEWLDHVIDAVRTPALHLAVFTGFQRWFELDTALYFLPLAFALLAIGHFMSQILAEQLTRQHTLRAGSPDVKVHPQDQTLKSNLWSVLILPIDTGVMCWVFVFWGSPVAFIACYVFLFVFGLVFAGISAHRKYRQLGALAK
ncbi:CDP-alcohol phosphatidyltransferase [Arthrobacter sp. MYb227]|uniref:CDP-alcohol phosphatidyltransferase family protein n=1 Tax=Arthrobacter sp. MYb227 TaxID=1848601 RepID=UPI000CFD04C8|nr:CDP-alcohol phosphatidyltransferase family protein [Arthrobacter sp. MYb227]PQZ91099.1 CDP-alcohol phosphatidyltransferase [Arthrobacter sp. MYb227]